MSTSTSIFLAVAPSISASPSGTTWWPWMTPMRSGPCWTTMDGGREEEGCVRDGEGKRVAAASVPGFNEGHSAGDTAQDDCTARTHRVQSSKETHLVPVSPDPPQVGRDAPQVLPRLAVGDVARRENLADLAGNLRAQAREEASVGLRREPAVGNASSESDKGRCSTPV